MNPIQTFSLPRLPFLRKWLQIAKINLRVSNRNKIRYSYFLSQTPWNYFKYLKITRSVSLVFWLIDRLYILRAKSGSIYCLKPFISNYQGRKLHFVRTYWLQILRTHIKRMIRYLCWNRLFRLIHFTICRENTVKKTIIFVFYSKKNFGTNYTIW